MEVTIVPTRRLGYEAVWAGVGLFVIGVVRWYFEHKAAPSTVAKIKRG